MRSASEDLSNAIETIRSFADRKEVGPAIKEELQEIAEAIEPHRERVIEIEGLYAIDFGDSVDTQIETAAEKWAKAEPGVIKDLVLQDIRSASPMLSELYVKGLDFTHAFKFDSNEAKLATWVGNHIDSMSDLLQAFRKERKSDRAENEWSILVRNRKDLGQTLNFLKQAGVIQGKKLLTKSKAGKWVPFKWDWFRDDPNQVILIVYEKLDGRLFNQFKGEWMSSYVHSIMEDQLIRHEIPFELYTMVAYKAPADLIRGGSDFDVVGRFRDTVVCVECKSGRLEQKFGHFDEIVQRTEDLRTIIKSMGAGDVEFLFFVAYDAELNDEEEVKAQFTGKGIVPLKLNEVRAVVSKTLADAIA